MRKNPTMSKVTPEPGPLDGIDNLPNPIGVSMKALKDAEKMPVVDMTLNNGTQTEVATPAFANGTDNRHFSGGPNSNPFPGGN